MTIERGNTLYVHCDVVHPDSGEVLAEPSDMLDISSLRAQHILAVCKAHAGHYFTYNDVYGNTSITAKPLALRWQQ